jgi:mannose-binding lectin 2
MGMNGDGKTKYDNDNDGESNRLGGCEANFRDKSFPTKARVKYYGDSKRVVVGLSMLFNRRGS